MVTATSNAHLADLLAAQRQALACFRGLVHAEIAQTMGVPLGTLKAWVRRGSLRLPACLQAVDFGLAEDP